MVHKNTKKKKNKKSATWCKIKTTQTSGLVALQTREQHSLRRGITEHLPYHIIHTDAYPHQPQTITNLGTYVPIVDRANRAPLSPSPHARSSPHAGGQRKKGRPPGPLERSRERVLYGMAGGSRVGDCPCT